MTADSPTTRDPWVKLARRDVIQLRNPDGGWGYYEGAESCVEPTALAALSLIATPDRADPPVATVVAEASRSLIAAQRGDGAIGVSASRRQPAWMTPYAVLLWHTLNVEPDRSKRAEDWLLTQSGTTMSRSEDPRRIAGHDTTLVGWPWVSNTHSWLEPTALAVLALGRAGQGSHPRVKEGLRLIEDRSVEDGGWNYGNKAVFGRPLRAQPAPTGLALLTLSGHSKRGPIIDKAIAYLRQTLPGTRASVSLAWGLIGLSAWDARPSEADLWLGEARAEVAGRPDAAMKLACLLLAAADGTRSRELFGR